jgi:hypothetical protein
MSFIAAWLQSTNTPACGSSNQTASTLRSKKLSNTVSVCSNEPPAALVLPSQSRVVADEFMVCDGRVYTMIGGLKQHLDS